MDDTTVVRLISAGDESAYRDEVQKLTMGFSACSLTLKATKTKEAIMDFRYHRADPLPLFISGDSVERDHNFKFLVTPISDNLSWSANSTAVDKKVQHHLHFLRALRKNNLGVKLVVFFFSSVEHPVTVHDRKTAGTLVTTCFH